MSEKLGFKHVINQEGKHFGEVHLQQIKATHSLSHPLFFVSTYCHIISDHYAWPLA